MSTNISLCIIMEIEHKQLCMHVACVASSAAILFSIEQFRCEVHEAIAR